MIKDVFILLIGFIALIKGADIFVKGSSDAAKNLKVPSVIIGLTIVALGTSTPELAVSVSAALQGSNEISVSNVVGSNIFNLLVVLGVCAMVKPLSVENVFVKRDIPVSIGAAAIVLLLCLNYRTFRFTATYFADSGAIAGNISRFLGLFILGVSGAVHPISVNVASVVDLGVLIFTSLLALMYSRTSNRINRIEGCSLVLIYLVYIGYAICR